MLQPFMIDRDKELLNSYCSSSWASPTSCASKTMMRFSAVLAWGFAKGKSPICEWKDADKLFWDVAHDVSICFPHYLQIIQSYPISLSFLGCYDIYIYMLCRQRENSLDVEDDQVKTALEIKAMRKSMSSTSTGWRHDEPVVSHHPGSHEL